MIGFSDDIPFLTIRRALTLVLLALIWASTMMQWRFKALPTCCWSPRKPSTNAWHESMTSCASLSWTAILITICVLNSIHTTVIGSMWVSILQLFFNSSRKLKKMELALKSGVHYTQKSKGKSSSPWLASDNLCLSGLSRNSLTESFMAAAKKVGTALPIWRFLSLLEP